MSRWAALKISGLDLEKLGFDWCQDYQCYRRNLSVEDGSVTVDIGVESDLQGYYYRIDRGAEESFQGLYRDAHDLVREVVDYLKERAQELRDEAKVFDLAADELEQEGV